jgi:hypothetical protein
MRPLRVLLANEFGAGRGHLVGLRDVALALGAGVALDAALCQRDHDSVLDGLQATIFDGPRLSMDIRHRIGPKGVPVASWGEYLGDLGLADRTRVRAVLDWWRHVFISRHIGLVVADYAPLALVAARSLGIATIAVGTAYGLPPWQMAEFPLFDPKIRTRLHPEARMLGHVNHALAAYERPMLTALPQIYRADITLVRSLAAFDPFATWREGRLWPPSSDLAGPLGTEGALGTEVFVYFSQAELHNPALLQALETCPLPRRGYLPGLSAERAARLAKSGMILEQAPVSPAMIARRSRLVVHAAPHGTAAMALFAGLPQLCFPQHSEQAWNAQVLARLGVGMVLSPFRLQVDQARKSLAAIHADPAIAARARAVAAQLHAQMQADPAPALPDLLRPFVAAIPR